MISAIPITKGVFKAEYSRALCNSEFAENLVNLMVGPAGENYDRPTLLSFSRLSSVDVIGSYAFGSYVVFVTADRRIHYMTSSGVVVDVTGTVLGGSARPTFTDDGSTVYIAGGAEPLKWEGPGNTTELLGGSPPNFTHIVYLDGYLIGNRRLSAENYKVIQFSEYETPETWTGTDIFSAVADPDPVSGLSVAQRELYVVGQKTTEIWQNIGSYPIPFARSFIWQYGTTAPYSILSEDNSIFFLDTDRRILRFSGRSFANVSEAISKELSGYGTTDDCWAASFVWNSRICAMFVFPTEGKAWSLDLANGQWTEWRGFSSGWSRARLGSLCYSKNHQAVYAGDFDTGTVWRFSDTSVTDAGGTFKRLRTFGWKDGGAGVRKQASMLRVKCNRHVASSYVGTLPETNPIIELRWRDEGKNFVDWRQASLGEIGESGGYAEFRRLGVYRDRQYEIQISDPARCSIVSVETDEEVMAS